MRRQKAEGNRQTAKVKAVQKALQNVAQRHRPFACCLLPFAFCLAFSTSGCGKADPYAMAERSIRRDLPELIGPARTYSVRVSRSETNLIGGKIGWVEIRGQDVRAGDTLTVDDLHVRLDEVRFNRSERSITSVGDSAVTARISAAAATRYIASRGTDYRDVRLEFRPGEAIVHASPGFLGIHIPVSVSGQPVVRSDTTIDFNARRLVVGFLPVPGPVLSLLERRINPVIDLKPFHVPLRLDGARIEAGYAVVTGTTDFPTPAASGG